MIKRKRKKRRRGIIYDAVLDPMAKVPNYETMSQEEQARRWGEFEIKYNQIAEMGMIRHVTMPDRKVENLTQVHHRFTRYVREIHISKEAARYKIFMQIIWAVIEYVLTEKLMIDCSGFLKIQCSMIKNYDLLLLRLGEESLADYGGGEPTSPWKSLIYQNVLVIGILVAINYIIPVGGIKGFLLTSIMEVVNGEGGEISYGGHETEIPEDGNFISGLSKMLQGGGQQGGGNKMVGDILSMLGGGNISNLIGGLMSQTGGKSESKGRRRRKRGPSIVED